MKKIILHLCADLGSDSYPYHTDNNYEVIKIGKDIGVENYTPPDNVHGVIANPVCTEYSRANNQNIGKTADVAMLKHCMRIIREANPKWWVIENPATGTMKNVLGRPEMVYQPWEFGSPWTKRTALWGTFRRPQKIYNKWEEVQINPKLYVRPGRPKCSLAFLHKSSIHYIDEFKPFIDAVDSDNAFRSLCSQGFAQAFKQANP